MSADDRGDEEAAISCLSSIAADDRGLKALHAFTDGLCAAHELGADMWGLTLEPRRRNCVNLYVGSLIVGAIGVGLNDAPDFVKNRPPTFDGAEGRACLWLMLNDRGSMHPVAQEVLADEDVWFWTAPDGFKVLSSSCGYYGVSTRHQKVWPAVRVAWKAGMSAAAVKYRRFHSTYQRLQLDGVVKWIGEATGRQLALPTY